LGGKRVSGRPLTFTFDDVIKQRPFTVVFATDDDRSHFCIQMAYLNPAITRIADVPKDPSTWTTDNVTRWLKRTALGMYSSTFAEAEITGKQLLAASSGKGGVQALLDGLEISDSWESRLLELRIQMLLRAQEREADRLAKKASLAASLAGGEQSPKNSPSPNASPKIGRRDIESKEVKEVVADKPKAAAKPSAAAPAPALVTTGKPLIGMQMPGMAGLAGGMPVLRATRVGGESPRSPAVAPKAEKESPRVKPKEEDKKEKEKEQPKQAKGLAEKRSSAEPAPKDDNEKETSEQDEGEKQDGASKAGGDASDDEASEGES